MRPLADRKLRELLDAVAERTPAPAGGSSAAVTLGLAAGLVEMVAAFGEASAQPSGDVRPLGQVGERAADLRARAAALAERELTAFAPVLEAQRLPRDDVERAARIDAALSAAAESPLEIARCAAEVAELALEALRGVGPHLGGDARAGALLADGACQAAAKLAAVDLAGHPPDARHAELAELTARAATARAAALRSPSDAD